ncbi:polysaccharide pyruvyl transferase, partial [Acinetobacter baumannii]|nr:polysaccharide pyruvyl transferase [Acinetobacter baumannii]
IDVEAVPVDKKYIDQGDLQSDWPTFEKSPIYCIYLRLLLALNRKVSNGLQDKSSSYLVRYINNFAMNTARKRLINTGIQFINGFDDVYT